MKAEKKKIKLAPADYRNILSNLELEEISLVSSNTKIDKDNFSLELGLKTKDTCKFEVVDNKLLALHTTTFIARGVNQQKPALEIKATYVLEYTIKNNIDIPREFTDIFCVSTIQFTIWPYFREFVQSMISRMNLPPLTLPMKKSI